MRKTYLLGISRWKESRLKPFFPNDEVVFLSKWDSQIEEPKKIIIWGKKEFFDLKEYAIEKNIPIYRVEDGFIRSVSLGIDFSQPYSIIVDTIGIYFDSTQSSELEEILNSYNFNQELLDRAKRVKKYLVDNKISKYNIYKDITIKLDKEKNQKTILVIGQVEGDASLIYGANSMKNIELLKEVYSNNPNAYIVYKPHPDVLNGNRLGDIEDTKALNHCNRIEKEVSVDSMLDIADEVHTMTSLVGFEALLRGKRVVCYGLPFYAGWGLTIDTQKTKRRKRVLSLEELIAGAYIVYPKYIDPITLKECEIERVLEVLTIEKKTYHNSLVYRVKIKTKNFIYKKYYALLRHLLKD
jgi:capsular polysaccharide export protein